MGFGNFIKGVAGISTADPGGPDFKGAKKATSPENLIDLTKTLQPLLRELQATGAIPGFQSAAATANARSGLTGTGLGNALTTAAGGAGEQFALQQALQQAGVLAGGQLQTALTARPVTQDSSNLFGQAAGILGREALGGFAFSGATGALGGGGGGLAPTPGFNPALPPGFNPANPTPNQPFNAQNFLQGGQFPGFG